jgi:ABC-2 type transport system permease protein
VRPLLQAELIKLRTTRTFLALFAVAVGLSLLLAILVATLTEPTQATVLDDVFNSDVSSLFILLLAVVGITGEWRHRTITSSLLAAPDRARFMLAKTLAFAAAGALLSLAISIAVAVVGFVVLSSRGLPTPDLTDLADLLWRNVLLAALLGAFGVGVGSLVRNQPVAIVGLLLVILIVEPLVVGLAESVGRFGPLVGAPTAIRGDSGGGASPIDDLNLLPPGVAIVVMLAWIAVTVGLGILLLRRRNVD